MSLHRRHRLGAIGALATLVCLIPGDGLAQRRAEDATIHVIPSELFTGELARLEPHLGLTTVCVKLERRGSDEPFFLEMKLEYWAEGKSVPGGSVLVRLKDDSEIAISLTDQPVTGPDGKPKYRLTIAGAEGTSRQWIDIPQTKGDEKGMNGSASRRLDKTVALGEKPLAIWGYMKGRGTNQFSSEETIEEMARRVEWALTMKFVRLNKSPFPDPQIIPVPPAVLGSARRARPPAPG